MSSAAQQHKIPSALLLLLKSHPLEMSVRCFFDFSGEFHSSMQQYLICFLDFESLPGGEQQHLSPARLSSDPLVEAPPPAWLSGAFRKSRGLFVSVR